MTFTQADLDSLKAALLTGALEVTVGDRTIRYRSQKEIMEVIRMIEEYLNGVSSTSDNNPSVIRPTFSKGES